MASQFYTPVCDNKVPSLVASTRQGMKRPEEKASCTIRVLYTIFIRKADGGTCGEKKSHKRGNVRLRAKG